jgi:hypothetical protein
MATVHAQMPETRLNSCRIRASGKNLEVHLCRMKRPENVYHKSGRRCQLISLQSSCPSRRSLPGRHSGRAFLPLAWEVAEFAGNIPILHANPRKPVRQKSDQDSCLQRRKDPRLQPHDRLLPAYFRGQIGRGQINSSLRAREHRLGLAAGGLRVLTPQNTQGTAAAAA